MAAGELRERFAQVGVVPVGTPVDHQQGAIGGTRCLRDEQLHDGFGGHGHNALGEHPASVPHHGSPATSVRGP